MPYPDQKYFKRNFVEALQSVLPELYMNKDRENNPIQLDPMSEIINSDLVLAKNFDKIVGTVSAIPGTALSSIDTIEGLSKYFVKQNKATNISPLLFEKTILRPIGKTFGDFSTSASFEAFLSGTFLPAIDLGSQGYPYQYYGDPNNTETKIVRSYGLDCSDAHAYLLNNLGWFYLLNRVTNPLKASNALTNQEDWSVPIQFEQDVEYTDYTGPELSGIGPAKYNNPIRLNWQSDNSSISKFVSGIQDPFGGGNFNLSPGPFTPDNVWGQDQPGDGTGSIWTNDNYATKWRTSRDVSVNWEDSITGPYGQGTAYFAYLNDLHTGSQGDTPYNPNAYMTQSFGHAWDQGTRDDRLKDNQAYTFSYFIKNKPNDPEPNRACGIVFWERRYMCGPTQGCWDGGYHRAISCAINLYWDPNDTTKLDHVSISDEANGGGAVMEPGGAKYNDNTKAGYEDVGDGWYRIFTKIVVDYEMLATGETPEVPGDGGGLGQHGEPFQSDIHAAEIRINNNENVYGPVAGAGQYIYGPQLIASPDWEPYSEDYAGGNATRFTIKGTDPSLSVNDIPYRGGGLISYPFSGLADEPDQDLFFTFWARRAYTSNDKVLNPAGDSTLQFIQVLASGGPYIHQSTAGDYYGYLSPGCQMFNMTSDWTKYVYKFPAKRGQSLNLVINPRLEDIQYHNTVHGISQYRFWWDQEWQRDAPYPAVYGFQPGDEIDIAYPTIVKGDPNPVDISDKDLTHRTIGNYDVFASFDDYNNQRYWYNENNTSNFLNDGVRYWEGWYGVGGQNSQLSTLLITDWVAPWKNRADFENPPDGGFWGEMFRGFSRNMRFPGKGTTWLDEQHEGLAPGFQGGYSQTFGKPYRHTIDNIFHPFAMCHHVTDVQPQTKYKWTFFVQHITQSFRATETGEYHRSHEQVSMFEMSYSKYWPLAVDRYLANGVAIDWGFPYPNHLAVNPHMGYSHIPFPDNTFYHRVWLNWSTSSNEVSAVYSDQYSHESTTHFNNDGTSGPYGPDNDGTGPWGVPTTDLEYSVERVGTTDMYKVSMNLEIDPHDVQMDAYQNNPYDSSLSTEENRLNNAVNAGGRVLMLAAYPTRHRTAKEGGVSIRDYSRSPQDPAARFYLSQPGGMETFWGGGLTKPLIIGGMIVTEDDYEVPDDFILHGTTYNLGVLKDDPNNTILAPPGYLYPATNVVRNGLMEVYNGRSLYTADGINALEEYLWKNYYGGEDDAYDYDPNGNKQVLNPAYGMSDEVGAALSSITTGLIPQTFLSGTGLYVSGDQNLAKLKTLNEIIYSPLYLDEEDKSVEQAFHGFTTLGKFLANTTESGPFYRFLQAIGFLSFDINNQVENIRKLLSIKACPGGLLPYLADLIGWTLYGTNEDSWRRQLWNAVDLYKKKGSLEGLEHALDVVLPNNPILTSGVFDLNITRNYIEDPYFSTVLNHSIYDAGSDPYQLKGWGGSNANGLGIHTSSIAGPLPQVTVDKYFTKVDPAKTCMMQWNINVPNGETYTFSFFWKPLYVPGQDEDLQAWADANPTKNPHYEWLCATHFQTNPGQYVELNNDGGYGLAYQFNLPVVRARRAQDQLPEGTELGSLSSAVIADIHYAPYQGPDGENIDEPKFLEGDFFGGLSGIHSDNLFKPGKSVDDWEYLGHSVSSYQNGWVKQINTMRVNWSSAPMGEPVSIGLRIRPCGWGAGWNGGGALWGAQLVTGDRPGPDENLTIPLINKPANKTIAEYYESYLPRLMYYMLLTDSHFFRDGDKWTAPISESLNVQDYAPGDMDTNIKYIVDHILMKAVGLFPDNFYIRNVPFDINITENDKIYLGPTHQMEDGSWMTGEEHSIDITQHTYLKRVAKTTYTNTEGTLVRGMAFDYRGRVAPIPPWEEENFYNWCDISQDLMLFIEQELVNFGVIDTRAKELKEYVLNRTINGDTEFKIFNNNFLFFTSSLELPPNYSSILATYDKDKLDYLSMWNGKSSTFDVNVSAGAFEEDLFVSREFNTDDFFDSLGIVKEFSPAKTTPRVYVSLETEDQVKGVDFPYEIRRYSFNDLIGDMSSVLAGFSQSGVDMRTSGVKATGSQMLPSFDFAGYGGVNNHTNLPVFTRGMVDSLGDPLIQGFSSTLEVSGADYGAGPTVTYGEYFSRGMVNANPSACIADRNSGRRRDLKNLVPTDGWYIRDGFNMPMYLNASDTEFLPLGLMPSSMTYQDISGIFDYHQVWDLCETIYSNNSFFGVPTANTFQCRGKYPIEFGQYVPYQTRALLPSFIKALDSIERRKAELEASATYHLNKHNFTMSGDYYDPSAVILSNIDYGNKIEDYTSPTFSDEFQRLYKDYTNVFDKHSLGEIRLDNYVDGGPNIFSHLYGPLYFNGNFSINGSSVDTSVTLVASSVPNEVTMNFNSVYMYDRQGTLGTFIASSPGDLFVEKQEWRNPYMFSGVELVDTSSVGSGNEFSLFKVSGEGIQKFGNTYLTNNGIVVQRAQSMLPRVRVSLQDYDQTEEADGKKSNFMIPEHEFKIDVGSIFGKDRENNFGGGAVGVWLHTKVEEDGDNNLVFWNWSKNNKWELVNVSSVTGVGGIEKVKADYAHSFNYPQVGALIGYPDPPDVSNDLSKYSLNFISADSLNRSVLSFNTKNRSIRVPVPYHKQFGQVHRLNQDYILEVFPYADDTPNSYFMMSHISVQDMTEVERSDLTHTFTVPDFSPSYKQQPDKYQFYYENGAEVPLNTKIFFNTSGDMGVPGEGVTHSLDFQIKDSPKITLGISRYPFADASTRKLYTQVSAYDPSSFYTSVSATGHVGYNKGWLMKTGINTLEPSSVVVSGTLGGTHIKKKYKSKIYITPKELINILRYFNSIAGGNASRIASVTSGTFELSGGSRSNYRVNPLWDGSSCKYLSQQYSGVDFDN